MLSAIIGRANINVHRLYCQAIIQFLACEHEGKTCNLYSVCVQSLTNDKKTYKVEKKRKKIIPRICKTQINPIPKRIGRNPAPQQPTRDLHCYHYVSPYSILSTTHMFNAIPVGNDACFLQSTQTEQQ